MTSSTKKPATPAKRGRPTKEIDIALVERLGQIHCTDEEIAAIVGVSLETFKRRKHDADFAERLTRAKLQGKASLRRMQWRAARAAVFQ